MNTWEERLHSGLPRFSILKEGEHAIKIEAIIETMDGVKLIFYRSRILAYGLPKIEKSWETINVFIEKFKEYKKTEDDYFSDLI